MILHLSVRHANLETTLPHQLSNKVAMVTGASQGIGQEIAKAFAQEGAKLCLISRNEVALQSLIDELHIPKENVLILPMDVTQEDACLRAANACHAHFGGLDILVNNAGIYLSKPFLEHSTQDFKNLMDVNLYGAVHMVQACYDLLSKSAAPRVINMASTAGKWGSKNQSAYNASKHALVGLTRCLALELAPKAITVNAICPGFVQTSMLEDLKSSAAQSAHLNAEEFYRSALARIPLGRVMRAQEIASTAVFLASDHASGITGQSIHVDGGMVFG